MAISQFIKRQKKQQAPESTQELAVDASPEPITVEEVAPDEVVIEQHPEAVTGPVYTHMANDVFSMDGNATFGVAEIKYNPLTGEAKVTATYNVSRLVGLSYAPGKAALDKMKKEKRS